MKGEFERYQALLDALAPKIRDAFVQAIQQVKDRATLGRIEAAIARGAVDDVADLLNLTPEVMSAVEDAIEATFREGGLFQASVGAFYPRHDRAIEWVREAGAALVVEINRGQRAAIRGIVTAGIDDGRNPNAVARDIIGTTNRATGRRDGGILGLTEREAGYVVNARREIEELNPGYFTRAARDRRYDPMVRKAIEAGKPLTQADLDRIIRRYSDGLLIRRGDRIARTEALQALNAGRYEAMQQQVERLGLSTSDIVATWQSARDIRTRDTHRAMRGAEAAFGQPFRSPSGALLRFPGDRALGAPAAECINCRCSVTYVLKRRA